MAGLDPAICPPVIGGHGLLQAAARKIGANHTTDVVQARDVVQAALAVPPRPRNRLPTAA
jgi:hypothetical protein